MRKVTYSQSVPSLRKKETTICSVHVCCILRKYKKYLHTTTTEAKTWLPWDTYPKALVNDVSDGWVVPALERAGANADQEVKGHLPQHHLKYVAKHSYRRFAQKLPSSKPRCTRRVQSGEFFLISKVNLCAHLIPLRAYIHAQDQINMEKIL